jgi:hypothetical protein
MALNHEILTFFRDVHLAFHPLEQTQITQFLMSDRRYFEEMLRSPSRVDLKPKIKIHNIVITLLYGVLNSYELKMKTDLSSLVNIGPIILTKVMNTLHQSISEYFKTDLNVDHTTSFVTTVLHNWTSKSDVVLAMMKRMCLQVSDTRDSLKYKQSDISTVTITVGIDYE